MSRGIEELVTWAQLLYFCPVGHLALQAVYLVGVLALGELAVEQGHVVIWLILDDLDPLPAARLVLGRLRHRVQLGDLRGGWSRRSQQIREKKRCYTSQVQSYRRRVERVLWQNEDGDSRMEDNLILLDRHGQGHPVLLDHHHPELRPAVHPVKIPPLPSLKGL